MINSSKILLITAATLACNIAMFSPLPLHREHHDEAEGGEDEIVAQATRSGRRVQDEAMRVDVINREEIEEELLMTPGNISMLVAEPPGVRVQVTSPALGSSNIRMQSMAGRYTQLLSDGLPLYCSLRARPMDDGPSMRGLRPMAS